MHVLSSDNRSEFLATPQVARFDFVRGANGPEPTLLIKGDNVLLKYIVSGARMELVLSKLGEKLLCGVRVHDDPEQPALLWSILERDDEKRALEALAGGEPCQTFLFNDIALNVAWAALTIDASGAPLKEWVAEAAAGKCDQSVFKDDVRALNQQMHDGTSGADTAILEMPRPEVWHPVQNTLITNRAGISPVDLFDSNEGHQQEQMAIWLTDGLHPEGACHSPQVPKDGGTRELTDVLLSYDNGSILIESKALSIFVRDSLPSRTKLANDVAKHVDKAIGQLKGAIKKLRENAPVTTPEGHKIEVERTLPMHAIILIPDFGLIAKPEELGRELIADFTEATGGFLHLLDVAELLRMVQGAEMIAARSETLTPMMAFDAYLIERANSSAETGTLCFEMLLGIED